MKTRILIMLAIVLALCGCKKASYLDADRERVTFSRQACADSVILRSDVNNFEILSAPEWVKTELADSVVRLSVIANETGAARKGTIVISDDDQKLSIALNQAAPASYMTLGANSVTIPQNGSEVTLKVETDGADVRFEGVRGVTSTYKDGVLTLKGEGNKGNTRSTIGRVVCDTIYRSLTVVETGTVCGRCGGKGTVTCYICRGEGKTYCPYIDCVTCRGRGRISCPACHGKGK